jgi:DNA-binding MarR family transcriptional regulator
MDMRDIEGNADDPASQAWACLVAAVMTQRSVWLAASQQEGLTPPQAMSLMRLDPDDPPRLGDLARFLRCDASQVTSTADRLEERGFAERRTAAGDRRVKELVLTPAGRAAQERLRRAFLAEPDGLTDIPEDDLRVLARVAERLAAGLDAELCRAFGLPVVVAEPA